MTTTSPSAGAHPGWLRVDQAAGHRYNDPAAGRMLLHEAQHGVAGEVGDTIADPAMVRRIGNRRGSVLAAPALGVAGVEDPIGPDNDTHLNRAAAAHDVVVFAWGAGAQPARARVLATRLWNICWRTGATVACLGWTASGQPRHSSRLAKDTPLLTLTADAHPDFVDVDPQWVQLLTDTEVLDSAGVAR